MDSVNYQRIEEAIKYLSENYKQQPSLYDVANEVHVSPFHFQKLFTEWAGVSPKKFLQYLTLEELKRQLHQSSHLMEAAERVGLSAQSRVYDLFVNIEAVTPHEYKTQGEGITIEYGFHETLFGNCLIAVTERGVCCIRFANNNEEELLAELHNEWKNATISQNQNSTKTFADILFNTHKKEEIKLLLKGTPFQLKVWEALLKIPFGALASYQNVANVIQQPSASRAVGSAIGANPIAYLIPCHRVIRQEAVIGEYRWGTLRKKALIGWEKALSENEI